MQYAGRCVVRLISHTHCFFIQYPRVLVMADIEEDSLDLSEIEEVREREDIIMYHNIVLVW